MGGRGGLGQLQVGDGGGGGGGERGAVKIERGGGRRKGTGGGWGGGTPADAYVHVKGWKNFSKEF